jgi:hypothetical protein
VALPLIAGSRAFEPAAGRWNALTSARTSDEGQYPKNAEGPELGEHQDRVATARTFPSSSRGE